jgi:hypothetical protein
MPWIYLPRVFVNCPKFGEHLILLHMQIIWIGVIDLDFQCNTLTLKINLDTVLAVSMTHLFILVKAYQSLFWICLHIIVTNPFKIYVGVCKIFFLCNIYIMDWLVTSLEKDIKWIHWYSLITNFRGFRWYRQATNCSTRHIIHQTY